MGAVKEFYFNGDGNVYCVEKTDGGFSVENAYGKIKIDDMRDFLSSSVKIPRPLIAAKFILSELEEDSIKVSVDLLGGLD